VMPIKRFSIMGGRPSVRSAVTQLFTIAGPEWLAASTLQELHRGPAIPWTAEFPASPS
jgi:hypothetical protein